MNKTLKSCLQKLTLPGYSPSQKDDLKNKVRALISHPMNLQNHPGYEKEALLLSDIFESVCNGMITGHPVQQLNEIDNKSLLIDWKHFILAIYYFYQNEYKQCLIHTDNIQQNHPVYALGKLLPLIMKNKIPDEREDLSHEERQFLARLIDYPQHLIKSFLELEEPLNENLEDIFTGSALLLLRDISVYNSELTEKYALWCLNNIRISGFSPKTFIKGLKPLLGSAESKRMIALSTIKTQPEISLLYWMKYLLEKWHNEAVPEDEIKSIMGLCGVLGLSVWSEITKSDDYQKILMDHMNQIIQELSMVYTEFDTQSPENVEKIRTHLNFWAYFAPGKNYNEEITSEDEIQSKGEQLELFG